MDAKSSCEEAIEKRRPAVARIEAAHRSSVLPLLGMVSWRAGRSIEWDGDKEQIINDPKANELLHALPQSMEISGDLINCAVKY